MTTPPELCSGTSGAPAAPLEDSPRAVQGGYLFAGRVYKYDYGRIVSRLGRAPDLALAREIGCAHTVVQRLRQALRIPTYDRFRDVRPLLGRIPDAELARRFGFKLQSITNIRKRMGIARADGKAWRRQQMLIAYVEALRSE